MSLPSAVPFQEGSVFWRRWLMDEALPLWAERGVNPDGGFFDRLTSEGEPTADPLRFRVQARQIYVFAEAGRLGWTGDWRRVVGHGLAFLLERATRPDGLVAHRFGTTGGCLEEEPDLYDQSFALFGYASAYRALGDQRARTAARRLLGVLDAYRHPAGGYRELDPQAGVLRANPQMHMLEAALAWAEVDDDPLWGETADQLHRLCAERLVEPSTGALREFFDLSWRPMAPPLGLLTEPGHHYEWGWLVARENGLGLPLAQRLCHRAEQVGIDPFRRVAVNAVSVDGQVTDAAARLWPQTERLKAALLLRHTDPSWMNRACEAADVLKAYLHPTSPGLWLDVMEPDGLIRQESTPASSFYHLVCAISELLKAAGEDA